ncbi:MAG: ABC-F family ATP-binding cassette domain-containing protein, partial [Bacteroidota bacterium]
MNYLTIEHISKAYGERILFQDLTFSINKGQKVAFVAKNGTGKSTVLRIIAGIEGSDGVGVVRIHRDVQVGYLDQDPQFEAGQTIMDAAFDAENPTIEAIREYEMALLYPDQQERIQKALTRMDELKAWDFDVKIKQILAKLNITDLNQRVETLSGGQQKRLALARVLINEPDFLILDEPTNHLDLEMIEWLENYLAQSKLTLFMVTHDRYFLERVCDTIIELDQGKIFKYKGNYSYFLDQKMAREGQQFREVMRARSMFKTELEWMRKMPKARGTKAKARIESFYELKEKAHQTVTNQQLEMQIQTTRLGSKIVEFHSVSKAFGTFTILEKFIYKFKKKDRVGIVGKNGVGKTTFLNMLMGVERPDSGKVVVGSTVQFGYYTQDGMQLNEAKRVIEVVR